MDLITDRNERWIWRKAQLKYLNWNTKRKKYGDKPQNMQDQMSTWSLTEVLGGDERANEVEEIMADSFPKMMAHINPQMQRKNTQ